MQRLIQRLIRQSHFTVSYLWSACESDRRTDILENIASEWATNWRVPLRINRPIPARNRMVCFFLTPIDCMRSGFTGAYFHLQLTNHVADFPGCPSDGHTPCRVLRFSGVHARVTSVRISCIYSHSGHRKWHACGDLRGNQN